MDGKICEHVVRGEAEPHSVTHKETGETRTYCLTCLVALLRADGQDPAEFFIGYNVYRSTDPNLPKDQWEKVNDKLIPVPEFKQEVHDSDRGKTFYHYITGVSALGTESDPSESEVITITVPLSDEPEAAADVEWPQFLEEKE